MIFFSPPEFNGVIVLCQYYKDIGVLLQQLKLPRINGNITINKGGRRQRKAGGGGGGREDDDDVDGDEARLTRYDATVTQRR